MSEPEVVVLYTAEKCSARSDGGHAMTSRGYHPEMYATVRVCSGCGRQGYEGTDEHKYRAVAHRAGVAGVPSRQTPTYRTIDLTSGEYA